MRWRCDRSFQTSLHTNTVAVQCGAIGEADLPDSGAGGAGIFAPPKEPRDSLVVMSNRRLGESVLIGVLGCKHS